MSEGVDPSKSYVLVIGEYTRNVRVLARIIAGQIIVGRDCLKSGVVPVALSDGVALVETTEPKVSLEEMVQRLEPPIILLPESKEQKGYLEGLREYKRMKY